MHNRAMPNLTLAFDRSARSLDADGRLHVARSHISKATVNPYYGKEIPDFDKLGLEPNAIYRLLRDPVELERGASTFARLPILSKHVPVTVDSPQPDLIIGAIGSDVQFASPYLDADLCFWDAEAITAIDTRTVTELSCAYRYIPVMEPGTFEGQPYDGRMTEIRGNHLALVEVGRAGPDVVVADSNPIKEQTAMKMTKLGRALFVALGALSSKLAADSALPALVGNAAKKTFKPADIKPKLIALDSELDPQQLDNVIDALLDVEQSPTPVETPMAAGDEPPEGGESKADKLRKLLAGKVDDVTLNEAVGLLGMDEPPEGAKPATPAVKPEEKPAMDAAAIKRDMREAREAEKAVEPVIGEVFGMDSAAEIYGYALDQMGVKREGVKEAAALKALFDVAKVNHKKAKPHMAHDSAASADLSKRFPNLGRFGHA